MSKRVLERCWNGDENLRHHPTLSSVFECIHEDICDGAVFPGLRENEIHLYHEGGRILRIRPKSAYTHARYLGMCGQKEISLGALDIDKYQKIKDCCQNHNMASRKSGHKETWIVSRLFERYSAWSTHRDPSQPQLIDIEVRLRTEQSAEMIDLLLIDDDGQLTFVEVKRQYDPRIRATTGDPEVVKQVGGYEAALRKDKCAVLKACCRSAPILAKAFDMEDPVPEPTHMFERVPILVCRRNNEHGRDTWLRCRLSLNSNGQVGSDLVVDGGSIKEGAYGDQRPPWCSTGLWQDLNLAMALKEVRAHN